MDGADDAIVHVLRQIHEDIKGLRASHEHMEKTLTVMTAQRHQERIEKLEYHAHDVDVKMAGMDAPTIKQTIEKLRESQVSLMVKVATLGGGAGLAGGGLVYWLIQVVGQ